jgi:hypothetical protein
MDDPECVEPGEQLGVAGVPPVQQGATFRRVVGASERLGTIGDAPAYVPAHPRVHRTDVAHQFLDRPPWTARHLCGERAVLADRGAERRAVGAQSGQPELLREVWLAHGPASLRSATP